MDLKKGASYFDLSGWCSSVSMLFIQLRFMQLSAVSTEKLSM